MSNNRNIRGLDKVLKNLNKEIKKIKGSTLKGLIRGALMILRDVELKSPLTPVDLGNLRASRFLVSSKGGVSMGGSPKFGGRGKKKANISKLSSTHASTISEAKSLAKIKGRPTVLFGFSAYYAAPVHEMSGTVNWTRRGSGGKWFERAIDRNIKRILTVIQKEAMIK